MDYHTADLNSWPAKLVTKVGKALRSNRAYTQAAIDRQNQKDAAKKQRAWEQAQRRRSTDTSTQVDVNELGEREYSIFSQASTLVEPVRDHTEMMHGLNDSEESLLDPAKPRMLDKLRDSYYSADSARLLNQLHISEKDERRVAFVPVAVWRAIAAHLDPVDAANLAITNKTLFRALGVAPFAVLRAPENRLYRIQFLHQFDRHLREHLFCFPCTKFHRRSQAGQETLKADFVRNPLFRCPNVRHSVLPRMRITHGRELPYAFVQLALRAHRHSPAHGISADSLGRRWRCRDSGWTHRTRYLAHEGRLLMRVVSQVVAPPATTLTETVERHLLYDREEYTPYFSVCAHWRDGELMRLCKCALSHVPAPPDPYHKQLQRTMKLSRSAARPNFLVRGCDDCRPARRCPECPTEYLIEVQMIEDTKDPRVPFKHALVVTRWSDLGDGSNPHASPEWVAVNGVSAAQTGGLAGYESFSHVGRRAVGGIFESKISGSIPGQRLLSLNPKNKKLGEDGHGWY